MSTDRRKDISMPEKECHAEQMLVAGEADAAKATAKTRDFAAELGFPEVQCDEIALAAQELASNLVKHAGRGEMRLEPLKAADRSGIQITSEDCGPGLPDAERALRDGYSTSGSLGEGLGAVNRLMDALEFFSLSEGGLRIVCRRWIRPPAGSRARSRLEFGAASRSYRNLHENGDAIALRQWEGHALAGVIDGLGHGQFAQRAALSARDYVLRHFDQPLDMLFRGVGRACRATRGVVMALARFDFERDDVEIASVGNVGVHLMGSPRDSKIVVRRGVVGMTGSPSPVLTCHPWTAASLLIMHSDGIETHWQRSELESLAGAATGQIARQLLETYGRCDDDATVVVAKNANQ